MVAVDDTKGVSVNQAAATREIRGASLFVKTSTTEPSVTMLPRGVNLPLHSTLYTPRRHPPCLQTIHTWCGWLPYGEERGFFLRRSRRGRVSGCRVRRALSFGHRGHLLGTADAAGLSGSRAGWGAVYPIHLNTHKNGGKSMVLSCRRRRERLSMM